MTPDSAFRRLDAASNGTDFAEFENLKAHLQLLAGRARGSGTPNDPDTAASAPRRGESSLSLSVGLDVVSVAEVAAALDRFGDRYIRRIFTPPEASYCLAAAPSAAAARFAARFAAKEAAVKALQPDRHWSDWRAIEVRRHSSGRCTLVLRGAGRLACVPSRHSGPRSEHEPRRRSGGRHRRRAPRCACSTPGGRDMPSTMTDDIRAILREHGRLAVDVDRWPTRAISTKPASRRMRASA